MSEIKETQQVQEPHHVSNGDLKARDEGPELVPYSSDDADLEAGSSREKKTGSPELQSYDEANTSGSHVGSVRRDGEVEKTKWEWTITYIYRRFRPLFHLAFWIVWTA